MPVNTNPPAVRSPNRVDVYWAPWSGPCRMFWMEVKELVSPARFDIEFNQINVEEYEKEAAEMDVRSVPTSVFYRDNHPVQTAVGMLPAAGLLAEIKEHIGDSVPPPAETPQEEKDMNEPIEITRDKELLIVTTSTFGDWSSNLKEFKEGIRLAGDGPLMFSRGAWELYSSWVSGSNEYVIHIYRSHRLGQSIGYRGKNDGIVPRDLATRYRTIEAAKREARELEEDDAEKRCVVEVA